MSPDLDADPGPSGLAEAGAGIFPEDWGDPDLSAPLEALPPQPFSLGDEIRLRPGRTLGRALFAGLILGLFLRRFGHADRRTAAV
ncbi:MAG: hypothetical protein WCJ52_07225 [Phenylobacterium sp.]|jgi:hypothetical protein|uniref:hypothetical protein n=1 Tax=Phenylobacterium sp. TaxID=1871053 RepID=UPI003016E1BF